MFQVDCVDVGFRPPTLLSDKAGVPEAHFPRTALLGNLANQG